MSNGFIAVGAPASTDKRLDTEELSVGGQTVQRERVQIAGATDVALSTVGNSAPAASAYGLSVRPVPGSEAASPQSSHTSSASVAAGGTATLDSAQVTSAKVGQLLQVIVAASVAWKAALYVVDGGVQSALKAVWFSNGPFDGRFAARAFTVTGNASAGLEGFRVIVTNLDTSEAADVYATFLWDEVS